MVHAIFQAPVLVIMHGQAQLVIHVCISSIFS